MNIFKIKDYKIIFHETLELRKKMTKGYISKLSRHMQCHSSLLPQVLNGPRNFTEEQVAAACEFLEFSKLESRYMLALLNWQRAGTQLLKNHYHLEIEKLISQSKEVSKRAPRDKDLSDAEKATFYSSWIYSAIHLLAVLESGVSLERICKTFHLQNQKAKDYVDFLCETGMLKKQDQTYMATSFYTHLNKGSPFLAKHHTNWRLKAIEASGEIEPDEMMYTAICTLSKVDFLGFKEELDQLIIKFMKMAKDSKSEEMAQLCLDFIRIRP